MVKTINSSHGQQFNSTHSLNITCFRGASQTVFGSCEPHQNNSEFKAKNAAVKLLGKVDGRQRDDTLRWDVQKPRLIYLTFCCRLLKANPSKLSPTFSQTVSILLRQSQLFGYFIHLACLEISLP